MIEWSLHCPGSTIRYLADSELNDSWAKGTRKRYPPAVPALWDNGLWLAIPRKRSKKVGDDD